LWVAPQTAPLYEGERRKEGEKVRERERAREREREREREKGVIASFLPTQH